MAFLRLFLPLLLSVLAVVPSSNSQRNVALLGLFGSTAENDHHPLAVFTEVNTVTLAEMDLAFKDARPDALNVRKVSQCGAVKGDRNFPRGVRVQPLEPLAEWIAARVVKVFPNLDCR